MQVRKRDGRVIDFEKKKIANAILAAMRECGKENDRTAARIANEISKIEKDIIDIEEIQDIVEEKLMASSMKDVAKAYILYREERNRERNKRTTLVKEIGEKFSATNVQNSNANMDEKSYGGMKGAAADVLAKDYALNFCMSEMARNNHLNNEIYTHKLNCA